MILPTKLGKKIEVYSVLAKFQWFKHSHTFEYKYISKMKTGGWEHTNVPNLLPIYPEILFLLF